jgi:hypothetical protein
MVIFVFRGFLVLDAMCATKTLQAIPAAPSTSTALPTCQFTVDFAASRHHYLVHFGSVANA